MENYKNDIWYDAAQKNTINLLPTTYKHYLNDYQDMTKTPEYLASTQNMLYWGIFQGDENGRFNGKSSITRAEAATAIYNLINFIDNGSKSNKFIEKMNKFEERRQYVSKLVNEEINNQAWEFYNSEDWKKTVREDWVRMLGKRENQKINASDIAILNIRGKEMYYVVGHESPQAIIPTYTTSPSYYQCDLTDDNGYCMHFSRPHKAKNPYSSSEFAMMDGGRGAIARASGTTMGGDILTEIITTINYVPSVMSTEWDNPKYVKDLCAKLMSAWLKSPSHKESLAYSACNKDPGKDFHTEIGYMKVGVGIGQKHQYGRFDYAVCVIGY
jgi:hypothetical protein